MNDKIISVLLDRYVRDCQKKELDDFERADLLRSMIKTMGVSQREFGRLYGIPNGTLQDWLLFGKEIDQDTYNELIKQGYTKSSIYRQARKRLNKSFVGIDFFASETARNARGYRHYKGLDCSKHTIGLLERAADEINSLIVHINLEHKKVKKEQVLS